jgi:hypothetical protein
METGGGGFDPGFHVLTTRPADGVGTVFCVFATVWDCGSLDGLPGPLAVSGLRLPGFADWLRALSSGDATLWALKSSGEDHALEPDWLALVTRNSAGLDLPALLRRLPEVSPARADLLSKEMRAGTLSEDRLRKDVHWLGGASGPEVIVQGGQHSIEFRLYDGFNWHVWFLFDDLWASAHPILARPLLRFGMPVDAPGD